MGGRGSLVVLLVCFVVLPVSSVSVVAFGGFLFFRVFWF